MCTLARVANRPNNCVHIYFSRLAYSTYRSSMLTLTVITVFANIYFSFD